MANKKGGSNGRFFHDEKTLTKAMWSVRLGPKWDKERCDHMIDDNLTFAPTILIAPTAVILGNVTIGKHSSEDREALSGIF